VTASVSKNQFSTSGKNQKLIRQNLSDLFDILLTYNIKSRNTPSIVWKTRNYGSA
jgi:hypothetical protein